MEVKQTEKKRRAKKLPVAIESDERVMNILNDEFEEVIEDLRNGFHYQELHPSEIDNACIRLKQIASIKRQLEYNPTQNFKDTSSKQSLGESARSIPSSSQRDERVPQQRVEGVEATSVSLAGQTDESALSDIPKKLTPFNQEIQDNMGDKKK